MSTTVNTLLLPTPAGLVPLDLDAGTKLLPTFQANDRTRPESIQSDFAPEFDLPGTPRNHALLGHAAAAGPTRGGAYRRLPCVLLSGGVEVLPLALLYVKSYREGRYQVQVAGGNRRLVEALGDKTLADLDLNRFNHAYTPAAVLAGLPYAHWQAQGWGYELFERGRPVNLAAVNPYEVYPSVSARLVLAQLLADAGFTADDLSLSEPLAAALNVPAANPYTYGDDFRAARALTAGYTYRPTTAQNQRQQGILRERAFAIEKLVFPYVSRDPYRAPQAGAGAGTGASYAAGTYTVGTGGYYAVGGSITLRYGCRRDLPGKVRCYTEIRRNGQRLTDPATGAAMGKDEAETGEYETRTFAPRVEKILLAAGDTLELWWRGDEIGGTLGIGPTDPYWQIGPHGPQVQLDSATPPQLMLADGVRFTVELLEEFPPGGLVRLQDWLPPMKQLDFLKAYMLLLGLTIQADDYDNHLHLDPGNRLLSTAHVRRAPDWTAKRDAAAGPGRLPERSLDFRFGDYAQVNELKWQGDDSVTAGYGDGQLRVSDEVLSPDPHELATLPFAATEPSQESPFAPGVLLIRNFAAERGKTPVTYTSKEAKPRLVLRGGPEREVRGKLVMVPAVGTATPQTADFVSTLSYFASGGLSLELNATVLTTYWQDLRAMLTQARYLTERYRLTPQDLNTLDFSVPIWDAELGDYFAVSRVSEYEAGRPVEVVLCRLNALFLPASAALREGREFYAPDEFYSPEYY